MSTPISPFSEESLTPEQSAVIETMRLEHQKTGLASLPLKVTIQPNGIATKKCDFLPWSELQSRQQTPEELDIACSFIADNKANGWLQMMGRMIDGTYRYIIDLDCKQPHTSEEIALGKEFLATLPQDTHVDYSANGGEHWIFDSINKPADGKITVPELAIEIIVNTLVAMPPTLEYARKHTGSTGVMMLNGIIEKLNQFLTSKGILTKEQKDHYGQVAITANGFNPSIKKVLGDNFNNLTQVGPNHYQGRAPHPMTEPSNNGMHFDVNTELNVWHNFHNNKGGSALQLYAIMHHLAVPGQQLKGDLFTNVVKACIKDGLLEQDVFKKYGKSAKGKEEKPKTTAGFVDKTRIIELCTDRDNRHYFVEYDRTTKQIVTGEPIGATFNAEGLEYTLPNPKDIVWLTAQTPEPYESINDLYADVFNFIYTNVEFPSLPLYHIATTFVLASWRSEDWNYCPYLSFISAYSKGKTRALDTLAKLCCRGFVSSSMSTAAMYVMIEKYNPTIFLDEIEKLAQDDKVEQIGIINSGYKKGAYVSRTKPNKDGEYELVHYPVGCFKGFAGTEAMKDTLQSRSINFAMRQNTRPIPMKFDESTAQRLRNQLLQYRFNMLGSLTSEDYKRFEVETADCKDGRIKEICHTLWMTMKDVTISCTSPKLLSNLESGTFEPIEDPLTPKDLLKLYMLKESEQRKDRNIDEYGYRILQSIHAAITTGCMNGKNEIPTQDIVDQYNIGLPPKEQKQPRTIGKKLKIVWEFEPSSDTRARGIKFDLKKYQKLCEEHNLQYDFSKLKTTAVNNKPIPIQGQQSLGSINSSPLPNPATIPLSTLYYRPIQPPQTHQCSCQAYQATVSIVTEQGEESFLCQQCFDNSRESGTCYEHISQKPT